MASCIDANEFPLLTGSSSSSKIDYLQEQLVYLQFNIARKYNREDILFLHSHVIEVLKTIKMNLHYDKTAPTYIQLLNTFYLFMFYTRDMQEGLGERTMSYILIMAFYDVFPALAIYAVHYFVQNSYKTENTCQQNNIYSNAIGSWKDMISICDFLRVYSKQGDKHSLIDICIEKAVTQLIKDNATWKHSIHAMNTHYISNVAKWIPREHKKYDWLFDRFVFCWSNRVHPHIFSTAISAESHAKAFSKCKRLFRKQIAYLNKQLHTTEIQMTNNLWNCIDHEHMSIGTYMKHFDKWNRVTADMHYTPDVYNQPNKPMITGSLPTFAVLVKHAIQIITCKESIDRNELKQTTDKLNAQWKRIMMRFQPSSFHFTIPILDVSTSTQQGDLDAFYHAIGIAITLASKSNIHCRMMAVAASPVWIQWKETDLFVDIVAIILESISSIQGSPLQYKKAVELIAQGICDSHSTPRFAENLNIVVISDFYLDIHNVDIQSIFMAKQIQVIPNMFFWNLSNHHMNDISTSIHDYKQYFYSGYSMHILQDIKFVMKQLCDGLCITSYNAAVARLNKQRYLPITDYLHSLCFSVGDNNT